MSELKTLQAGQGIFLQEVAKQTKALDDLKKVQDKKAYTEEEIEKAASSFEALLLQQMLKGMWETVNTAGLLGEDSNQADIYRGMFHQALADRVASGRGIGVKDFLRKELVKLNKASKE